MLENHELNNTEARPSSVIASLATFDPEQFTPGAPRFLTNDEESSGIIDTDQQLGDNTFLFDAQVHKPFPVDVGTVVEYGQLLRLEVDDWYAAYQGGQPTR